ncbi:hypothetical protein H072_6369 [Dactylellina haptotyla CBS 200.50]|uniref:F-box domain-containing protein n=1 Tax=Dactylellina haptotyla (strain CBS 200.50) TaxID=1284197 RepID=S8BXB0_DACHA|nr:hypothetical protein H072_6369 [Dactylellina haptotyla CBS 200.50]
MAGTADYVDVFSLLPVEIGFGILSYLTNDYVKDFALVSKAAHTLAVSRLFRTVDFEPTRFRHFEPGGILHHLCPHVREIYVPFHPSKTPYAGHLPQFFDHLDRFPHIISLRFYMNLTREAEVSIIATIFARLASSRHSHNLIKVYFTLGSSYWAKLDSFQPDDNQFFVDHMTSGISDSSIPPLPNLEEVTVYHEEWYRGTSFLFPYLASLPKLRKLALQNLAFRDFERCYKAQSAESQAYHPEPMFPNLTKLSISNKVFPFGEQLRFIVRMFPNLRKFSYELLDNYTYSMVGDIHAIFNEYKDLMRLTSLRDITVPWPVLIRYGETSFRDRRRLDRSDLDAWIMEFLKSGLPLERVVFQGNLTLMYKFRGYITGTCYVKRKASGTELEWDEKKKNPYGPQFEVTHGPSG